MTIATAVLLGLVQGIAELFPLSSLGILVILPHVTALKIPTRGAHYLPFLVALHLGTALSLLWFFRHDWQKLLQGFVVWLGGRRTLEGHVLWMVIWATVPAGLVGLVFKHRLAALFGRPSLAAAFLVVNGFIMLTGDRWHALHRKNLRLAELSIREALTIGLFQVLALIPGLSRSGNTITGGIGLGLRYEEAARFSFLMATPIILAAGLVELPHLARHGVHHLLLPSIAGGLVAAVTAWLSVRFLMRYFEHHRLRPFAFLSMTLGLLALLIIR
jgi:undecaprenyl-diphosphatase